MLKRPLSFDDIPLVLTVEELMPILGVGRNVAYELVRSSSTRRDGRGGPLRDFYIQEAVNYIQQNYHRDITVEEIADVCKLNRSYFSKLFREAVGCAPQEFIIRLRLTKAAEQMRMTNETIGDIARQCGYPNQLHFSQAFKKRYGLPPREWRKQNKTGRG